VNARRLSVLLSLLSLTASGESAQLPPTPLQASSEPIARLISGTETHEYRVALKAQQALHIVVKKLAVNVALSVSGPDGEPIVEMISPIGPNGADSLWVIASKTGDYLIGVRCRNPRGGRYELRVEALRDATADDRKHLELQNALLTALRLDNPQAARDSLRKAQGLAFLERVRDALPPANKRVSVEESLVLLEKISPGFVKWAADLAAQPPSGGAR
jgi:hypothetical protein